jgi:hypothetical protein
MNGISVNGIVRMGALNSFGVQIYLFLANEFVQISALNFVFKELL